MQTKRSIRQLVRQRWAGLTAEALAGRSEAILRRVEALAEFRAAAVVAAYWSLPDEVATHDFVRRWCGQKSVLLPVMLPDGWLELRPYRPGSALVEAAFGVAEPSGECVSIESVELILVPGVAFDRRGDRLGRGKGYYDRLLTGTAALKVGVCFDFQLLDNVPVDPHDIPMDRIVSEGAEIYP